MLPLGGALTTAGNGHINLFRVGLMPVKFGGDWPTFLSVLAILCFMVKHQNSPCRLSTKAHSFECNLRPTH